MSYLNFKSLYDKDPKIHITDSEALFDKKGLVEELKNLKEKVLVFETYPGVDEEVLKKDILLKLKPTHLIHIEDYTKSSKEINEILKYNITDDRVFGVYSHHTVDVFYDEEKIKSLREAIHKNDGVTVVYGFGASLIKGFLIHVGLTRWEIQLRFRRGLGNFKANNENDDILRKYKRAFFIEWRIADRIKETYLNEFKYFIDYNDLNNPLMIKKETYLATLKLLTYRPFRMVPYFDPGVWGGQWMKEVCNLDENNSNYAWSFDGVPEENSLKLTFGSKTIHMPAQDLVQFYPKELMGSRVHARFGKMFPIRFDLLDTMEGGNLSLQVHPLTEYIFDKFGMTYTQDESYYILDTKDDGVVYLGFKEGVKKDEFEQALIDANEGKAILDDKKYINKFVAKKHDHYSIPAGTIHCSGKNTMVLEISACNYIFTFKLWDWGRLGLDGKPRPVHLEHGFKNLQYDRTTSWVKENLVNPFVKLNEFSEKTGLHEREFLSTIRYRFKKPIKIENDGTVMMANLVEGKAALISSPTNVFKPYEVHYAETFIIPAGVSEFMIESLDPNEEAMIITAKVRV
ncbi:class I mannose-6-phosphate isomerase [Acholeplasma hippikon]|nr:class I mannose-6-phosphate isomerase [Acholeplasma hippikon]